MSGRIVNFVIGSALIAGSFIFAGPLGGTLSGLMLSAGASLAANSIFGAVQRQRNFQTNAPNSVGSLPVIYGKTRVWPSIIDVRVDPSNKNDLYVVLAVCHGSRDGSGIAGLDEIYFDDKLAVNAAGTVQSPYSGKVTVTKYLGTTSQTVDATLHSKFPSEWPSTSAGKGIAYLVLKLTYDQDVFPGGLPTVSVITRGNKLFDPRTSSWSYSTNPVLAVYDYLASTVYGLGVPSAELTAADFITEANYADENVTTDAGTADRFTANGMVDTSQTVGTNLKSLLSSCRGWLVYEGGAFRMFIRKVKSAASYKLTEDQFIGDLTFNLPGIKDSFNRITGRIINPANSLYQADGVQWPRAGASNSFLTDDNNFDVPQTLELPFTQNKYTAEQILMVLLRESRDAETVTAVVKEAALQLQVGDVVAVSHSTPGWSDKLFWVLNISLALDGTVRLSLIEYNAAAYSLDTQAVLAEAPNGGLPDPSVCQPPTGLTLLSNSTTAIRLANGQAQSRIKVSWTASPDPYLHHYLVRLRVNGATNWAFGAEPPRGDVECYLNVASDVTYDVELSAVNTLGVRSTVLTNSIRTDTPGGVPDYGANMLVNGDASKGQSGNAAPSWINSNGNPVTIATDAFLFGDRCLKITNPSAVDSQNYQEFTVPDGAYILEGWIKTSALPSADAGKGACLNVNKMSGTGSFVMLERIGDEFTPDEPDVGILADDAAHDFTYVASIFLVTGGGMTLRCYTQLGHTSGQSGTAWFAGVRFSRINANAVSSFTDQFQLDAKTQQDDGTQKRPLVKGLQFGTGRDGDHITFSPAFQNPPKITVWGGANIEPNSANWSVPSSYNSLQRHYDDAKGVNITAAGFDIYAKLRQPGAATLRTNNFTAGTLTAAGQTKSVTVANAPARDDSYTVIISMTMTLSSKYATKVTGTLVWAVDVDNGSGFVQQAIRSFSMSTESVTDDVQIDSDFAHISATGWTSTTQVRVRFVSFDITGVSKNPTSCVVDPDRVQYYTATDITASKTPLAQDFVNWRAEGFV